MTKSNISRRVFIEGGLGLTVANFVPGTTPLALAASSEERTVAAAKAAGAADVSGMIWSPYLVPMQPVIAEFKKLVASSGIKMDDQSFQADLPFIRAMIRYDIDLALFGVATARRHLVEADPQARYAMGLFDEAARLTEMSRSRATRAGAQ